MRVSRQVWLKCSECVDSGELSSEIAALNCLIDVTLAAEAELKILRLELIECNRVQ
jgi:hypothetical protein